MKWANLARKALLLLALFPYVAVASGKEAVELYDSVPASWQYEPQVATVAPGNDRWYPSIGIAAGWERQRSSGDMTPDGHPMTTGYFQLGLNFNWEIDVFGRVLAQVKEGKAALARTQKVVDAMSAGIKAMEETVENALGKNYSYAWTGEAY